MKELPNWDVWNDVDIVKMLWYLSTYHEDDCADCKVVCCANQLLDINREEIKTIAKHLKMDVSEFRFKHTILIKNFEKYLLKKFGEGGQFKVGSDLAKRQMNKGGRILLFDHGDDKIMIGENECAASYCPFYNKKTHRCKIHEIRPGACRIYPYEKFDEWLNLRKVNACLVSTNFLLRFSTLMVKAKSPYIDEVLDDINKALASKEYHSRYPLHWLLVIQYLILEFAMMEEEKLASALLERWEVDMKLVEGDKEGAQRIFEEATMR